MATTNAMDVLDGMISSLEKELGLGPNDPVPEPASAKKDSKNKQEGKKKEKKKKAPKKPAAAPANQPEVTKLDIRVGTIMKAWKHESADKLYCEEIDVGEESPRLICSGLVHHYALEEMQNRRVLVLCNLKARNMVGFKSHGMVMCAAKAKDGGGESVAFVEPPAGAKNGEKVFFDGLEGEPISPAQVEKKKVLTVIGDDMMTDESGVAKYKEYVFNTSAGPCTATSVPMGVIR